MKTEHVVQVLVSDRFSGSETIAISIAASLIEHGHKSSVTVPDGPAADSINSELSQRGIESIRMPPLFGDIHDLRRSFPAYLRVFRKHRPTIAHFHIPWAPAGWEGVLAAKMARVPRIVRTDHNPIVNKLGALDRYKLQIVDRCTSRAVNVSAGNRLSHIQNGGRSPSRLQVIPNGTDAPVGIRTADRERIRAELGLEPTDFAVAMLGYLEARKGPIEFVRAAAVAAETNPRLTFLVFGNGPVREDATALGRALGIGERLRFVGRVSDSPRWLAGVDCFTMPSEYEGLSMALLEATTVGLPVVAYEVDGLVEVFPGLVGCLTTNFGNHHELGRLIARVSGDDSLAKEMQAFSLAGAKRLTGEAMRQTYLEKVYDLE